MAEINRDLMRIIGKRVKSTKDAMMFRGFPGSDHVQVLPAGRPSPEIHSYLPSGYFELSGDTYNWYLLDSDSISIVDDDEADESTFFSRIGGALFDLQWNTSNEVKKQAGFLETGFKESVVKMKYDLFDLGKYVQQTLLVILAIAALWFISKLIP